MCFLDVKPTAVPYRARSFHLLSWLGIRSLGFDLFHVRRVARARVRIELGLGLG